MNELRVIIEDETDPTFPESWGWPEDECAEYMAAVGRGDFAVVWAHVQERCECCGTWNEASAALSDIHVKTDDLYALDFAGRAVVTVDDIPAGPVYPRSIIERGDDPERYALPATASDNYLLQIASDLLAEAREELAAV